MRETQVEREARLMKEGREKILAHVMQAEKKGKVGSLPYTNFLVRQFLREVAAQITADNTAGAGAGAFKKFAVYLGSLDPEIVALRAIQAVLGALLSEGGADAPQPIGKRVARDAGRAAYFEYLMVHFAALAPPLFNSLYREYARSMTSDEAHLIRAFKASFKANGYEFPTWGFGELEMVGNYLLQVLQQVGFVEVWNKTERKAGRATVVKYVALAEELRSASLAFLDEIAEQPAVAAPLVEPPLDWSAATNTGGGFHTPAMQRLLPYAVQRNGMRPVAPMVVETLNILQQVPLRINRRVLDIVQQASVNNDFGVVVGAFGTPKPEFPEGGSLEDTAAWKVAARQWYTERRVRKALHRKAQRVFQDARELQDLDAMWFAWFADSRGRKYVRAGGVSPQGHDLEKGVLEFAKAKPLGSDEAVFMFLLAGSGRYGVNKVDFNDRLRWVEENHDAIMATAEAPLDAKFWMQADNGDQAVHFLAWALEYADWHKGGRRLDFESRLIIGQDGTCNGLQNYSALLADEVGGAATNLCPLPQPQDIYMLVAERTAELLDAMPSSPLRNAWGKHGVNRKITKRTTMTLPYGCTRFGCSQFIVEDYLEKVKPAEIPMASYGEAANFLSHVMWSAIGDVVVKAREGMDWLKGWAKHAIDTGHPVAWTAPNGLYVRSEYRKTKDKTVKSVAFKSRIRLVEYSDEPNKVKTANAVAPNFIHSLDAAHLDFVVHAAHAEGIQMVAVHDDYGTHAADSAALYRIIREQFVLMYKDNTILSRMASSTGYDKPPPATGTLDVAQVLDAPFFFAP